MENLLTLDFWFNLRPGVFVEMTQRFFIAFVVALFILAFVSSFMKKKDRQGIYKKIWQGLYYFSITNVFIGSVLMFFTYEMVPLLSARFWFLIWGAGMVVWLYFIIRKARDIPKKKEEREKEKEFKKYIP